MDEVLLAVSRLTLVVSGVGGSIAVVVAAARRRVGWLPAVAAALILLTFALPAPWQTHPMVIFVLLLPWFVGFPLFAATFPDGRFVPRWSVWIVAASIVVLVLNALTGDAMRQADWWIVVPAVEIVFAGGFIVYRYRRSATTAERESVRWVLLGLLVTFSAFQLTIVTDGEVSDSTPLAAAKAALAGLPLIVGLVIGAAWPRVWNVDAVFRGVLVVLGAGWAVGGVYAATVGLAASAGHPPAQAAGCAAIAVAVATYPLVRLAMRLATWLVYRDRLGPEAAVAKLATAFESDDARSTAQRVTDAAAATTSSPAVWLSATAPEDADVFDACSVARPGAERGGAVPASDDRRRQRVDTDAPEGGFAVTFRGELLATLHAAPRAGESELSARDRATLAAIAQHASAALYGARTLQTATAAQADLVNAREEERRALRRELHDDLGPALSGLALSAAAIARRADTAAPELAADARELQSDIADAVERARDISHGLRPAVLDDRGLEAALRDRIGDVEIEVGDLGVLPAAVDLAALRIVQEAVTNVRRHAHASACRVRVDRDASGLRVEIADDGIGMPRGVPPGLGLRSIRERAAELGGRARVSRRPAGGTIVSVWLPIGVGS